METYSKYYVLTVRFYGKKAPVVETYNYRQNALTEMEFLKEYYGAEFASAQIDHPFGTMSDGRTDQFCECF